MNEIPHASTSTRRSGRLAKTHARDWCKEMRLVWHDHARVARIEPVNVPSAALEHGALIDVALVGDLAGVDGRRMLEHQQSRWRHGASCGLAAQRSEGRLQPRKHLRLAEA